MKKRISISILCLVMLVVALFAFSSCGSSCEHEWGEWTTTTAVSCDADGEREHTCNKCGHVESDVIHATGHAYGAWTITTPAGCVTPGVKERVCANCTEKDTASVYALGHTYGSWINEVFATCTTDGIKAHYFCSRCNLNYDKSNNLIEDVVIPAGHKFAESWGYTDADGHAHLCTVCGTKDTVLPHIPGDAPTPTTPQTCTECQYILAPAEGHVCAPDDEWSFDATHHWHGCVGCEEQEYDKAAHEYDNVCDTTCNVCGAVRATQHTYDNSCDTTCNVCGDVRTINHTYDNNCDASCNVCGDTRDVSENHVYDDDCDTSCSVCGNIREVTHDYEQCTSPATCTNRGSTYNACSKCGYVDPDSIEYTALAPCQESYTVESEASCSAEGLGVYTCSECGNRREVVLGKLDHEYASAVTDPTCEADGYTTYTCACGDSYIDNIVPAEGHSHQFSAELSYDADCENSGLTVEVCSCGDRIETVIPATGHDMVAPTCTAAGYCRNPDCLAVGEPQLAHVYSVLEEHDPDCTHDGYIIYKCDNCPDEKTEVPEAYKATGHNEAAINWNNEEIEAPTRSSCMFVIQSTGVCPDCNETVTKTGEPFEKHSYTCAITTEATCVKPGIKTYTCKCGEYYTSEYTSEIDAHLYDEGVTDTLTGITTYTCINTDADGHACGSTKTAVSAKTEVSTTVDNSALKDSEQVELKNASLALDGNVKDQIGDKDVSLSAGVLEGADYEAAISGLDETQLGLLNGGTIYNFEMEIGGNPTSEFAGDITIRVRYDLAPEDDPEDITVWYLKDGVPTLVDAIYVIIDNVGYAEFSTNHFSYYTVTKLTPEERCARYEHNYVTVTLPATCMEGGYTVDTCRRCGHREYYNHTAALGHDFKLNEDTHVEVNCTVNGVSEYSCERCQVSYTTVEKATGHSWVVDTEASMEATCEHNGKTVFTCENENCKEKYENVITKLDHNLSSEVTAPTCTTGGFTTNVCEDCGFTSVTNRVSALGHNVKDEVHAPTCKDKGYTSHVCEVCGTVFANTDELPKTDHVWNIEEPGCDTDKVCIHCNTLAEGGKAHGHSIKNGVCEFCGKECDHDLEFSHETKPSCSQPGYKVYKCNKCHAFVNGELIPTVSHNYTELEVIAATCTSAMIRIDICVDCGQKLEVKVGEKLDHEFVNGVCTMCGKEEGNGASDLFYMNLFDWSHAEGFVLKLEDISFSMSGDPSNSGYTTFDLVEIWLYIDENGELQGAGHGNVAIFNGPVPNELAEYKFEAVISEGNLYLRALGDVIETADVVVSLDYVKESLLSNMFGTDYNSVLGVITLVTTEVLPQLADTLISGNEEAINSGIELALNLLFTRTEAENGYVFVLDFDKIQALSDDLATLTVAGFVDKYIGEGTYTELLTLITEILELELADLPTYLADKGVPVDTVIEIINTTAARFMPADMAFDLYDYIYAPEMAGVKLGMLIFGTETYAQQLAEISSMLTSYGIYTIMGVDAAEIQAMVGAVIEQLREVIAISFTTDKDGFVTGISFGINELAFEAEGDQISLSLNLSLTVNGSIDVTWGDIADDIEDSYELPEGAGEEDYESDIKYYYNNFFSEYEYKGTVYSSFGMEFYYQKEIYRYTNIVNVLVMNDCGSWKSVQVVYPREMYHARYRILNLALPDASSAAYVLLIDDATGIIAECTMTENGLTAVLPDGTTVDVPATLIADPEGYAEMFAMVFGEMSFKLSYSETESDTIFYNPETGEFAYESNHNYVPDENASYPPTDCGHDGYNAQVCTKCGDKQGYFYNRFDHSFVIDYEQSYIPQFCEEEGYLVYVCSACGYSYKNYTYKSHNYVEEYHLSEGSLTCEDGVDRWDVCTECHNVLNIDYNWDNNHHYAYTYTYEGGKVAYTTSCQACTAVESFSGIYFTVDTKENLVYAFSNDQTVYFAFTPTVSGRYCFYSTGVNGNTYDTWGEILDSSKSHLVSNDDRLDNGQFGIIFEFEAGVTYYLGASTYNDVPSDAFVLKLEPVSTESVSLAPYGCGCGGELVITTAFGKKEAYIKSDCQFADMGFDGGDGDVEIKPVYPRGTDYDYVVDVEKPGSGNGSADVYRESGMCRICGFAFRFEHSRSVDDDCNEIESFVAYFSNVNTPDFSAEYEIYSVLTGYTNHETDSKYDYRTETETDEQGNLLTLNIEEYVSTCHKCGKAVSSTKYISYYDQNGNRVRYVYEHATANSDGEFTVRERRITTDVYLPDLDGNPVRKDASIYSESFNANGELIEWEKYEYVYHSICHYTETHTTSYNINPSVTDYYGHSASWKDLPDESGIETVIGDDGETYTVVTEAEEAYCIYCFASLDKTIIINTYDANGNLVRNVREEYGLWAKSDESYGWYLRERQDTSYGVLEYALGKFVSYETTRTVERFNEMGITISSASYRRDYCYDSLCEYDYYVNEKGEEYNSGHRTSHLAMVSTYVLSDGAESCLDGLDYYNVCLCCDYRSLIGENWANSHQMDRLSYVTVDLADFGSSCGGYVTIYDCPCRQAKQFDWYCECDFDYSGTSGWEGDEERFNYYKYTYGCAVNDPEICGFTYTYESWRTADSGCMEWVHYRYVLGTNTDNPYVVEWSYPTGSYLHNTSWESTETQFSTENGYDVESFTERSVCRRCGHVSYKTDVKRYSKNGDTVREITDRTYYYAFAGQVPSQIEHTEYEWFTNSNGSITQQLITYRKTTNYNHNGDETSWQEQRYSYDECIYTPYISYTYSDRDPEGWRETHDIWDYNHSYWIEEPTCTQDGIDCRVCPWCKEVCNVDTTAYGHNFWWVSDNCYECSGCGLMSTTGNDGNLSLEDLTNSDRFENGTEYIIGYDFHKEYFDYMVVLTLVVEGMDEPIFLETLANDDFKSIVRINLEELRAEVESLGYSLCKEMLRVTFVPLMGDTSFDYSITLDPHFTEEQLSSTSCGSLITKEVCKMCGECSGLEIRGTDDSSCNFWWDNYNDFDEEGNPHTYNIYTCECGFVYLEEFWQEKDENGRVNEYTRIVLEYDRETDTGSFEFIELTASYYEE